MENKKYTVIPQENMVDMQLSAVFMTRIQSVLQYIARNYGNDAFLEFAKKMIEGTGEPQNEVEEHIVTLASLINEFESNAKEQGKTIDLTEEDIRKASNGN